MIEVRKVTKEFGATTAVRDLTLTIPRGELFCFLGPNGAGKTTTIKMLCGLLKPTRGEIRIGGLPMVRDAVEARRLLGYIPDTPFLYERLTPEEFMEFTGDLYGLPPAQVKADTEAACRLFGLQEYRQMLIKDLSHGMRQRLAYASTFLHQPQVLLVDEPFIGLDPHSIRLIKDLLKSKARAGMTILLTTHILALAEDLADRIGIMMRGELIALGTLAELMKQNAAEGRLEDLFLRLTGE
jgi:ABC-2 type transport system ATP-binding protein